MSQGNFSTPLSHPGLDYLNQLEIWKGVGGFGVSKIAELMRRLGNPQDQIPTLHIAGTNGKGSVSATLASIMGAAGKRTGLNTSPHLHQFNERIVIDGVPVAFDILGTLALEIKRVSEELGIVLSFHEGITALSFLAFKELGVEFNVIEVGLGGRYDASNIISKPVAAVITSIDLDHQHILGDTRPKIAREKAGIIKASCPVITGPLDSESFEVVESIAHGHKSTMYSLGRDFFYTSNHDAKFGEALESFDFSSAQFGNFAVEKGIRGRHQFDNMSVAIAAARSAGVDIKACQRGVREVFWSGRLEVFNWKNRTVIIDCAHNPHGVRALVDNLKSWQLEDLEIAFGVLDTKDWEEMIDLLAPLGKEWSLLSPDSERALNTGKVASRLSSFGISFREFGRDYQAFIQNHETSSRPLLLTGSIYLIGEMRPLFGLKDRVIWNKY